MKEHDIACARMPSNSQVHVAYIANLLMLPRDAIVRVLIKYWTSYNWVCEQEIALYLDCKERNDSAQYIIQ